MAGEIRTQDGELFVAPGGTEINKVLNVQSATGFGGPSNDIDITNWDSDAMEFLQGLEDPGTATIEINWDPRAESHIALWDLKNTKTAVEFCYAFSNGSGELPTAAAGVITAPAFPRSSLVFTAVVQQITLNAPANDVIRATVQLRISGAIAGNFESGSPSV